MGWELEILEIFYKTLSGLVTQLFIGFAAELRIW
jgi:hypothetical protein